MGSPIMPSTQPMGNMSPQYMLDFLINNTLINKLANVVSKDTKFSVKNILKIFVLFCVLEMKTPFNEFIKINIKKINLLPDLIKRLYLNVKNYQDTKNKKIPEENIIIRQKEDCSGSFSVEVTETFFDLLFYNLKKLDGKFTFDKELINVYFNNYKEKFFLFNYNNLKFSACKYQIKIMNHVMYKENMETSDFYFTGCTSNQKTDYCSINSLRDLPMIDLNDHFDLVIDKIKTKYKTFENFLAQNGYRTLAVEKYNDGVFNEFIISLIMKKRYPNLNLIQNTLELSVFFASLTPYLPNMILIGSCYETYQKKKRFFFDNEEHFPTSHFISHATGSIATPICSFMLEQKLKPLDRMKIEHFIKILNVLLLDTNGKNNSTIINVTLNIKSESLSKQEVLKRFFKHLDKCKKNSEKIKIKLISLKKNVKIIQVPNPEYQMLKDNFVDEECFDKDFEPTSNVLKNNISNTERNKTNKDEKISIQTAKQSEVDNEESSIQQHTFMKKFNKKLPPQTIPKEEIDYSIVLQNINEAQREMNRLYLKKNDKDKLLKTLQLFRDKKEHMKLLGIENKLNILLYGSPGTGKSTTIQAVATFLQRDLYFLDLKQINTNEQLMFICEYVNKNIKNSGIIVIEDIDAMTPIVLKRNYSNLVEGENVDLKEKPKLENTTQIIASKDQQLTLEFFLNILQGTLTLEDSIFIITTNHYKDLDPAFVRDNRFDLTMELGYCDHYQIENIFKDFFGRNISQNILKKIPEYEYPPCSIIAQFKNYLYEEKEDEEIMRPFFKN